jgi:hypothetical protein
MNFPESDFSDGNFPETFRVPEIWIRKKGHFHEIQHTFKKELFAHFKELKSSKKKI